MKPIYKITTAIIVLILATVAFKNFSNPFFWYDESGQFFISKGLNHYSEPFAIPQGFGQVLENNRNFNLDPGGFSFLLYFWSMVSNSAGFLRVLPFLFFCGFIIFAYKIVFFETKDKTISTVLTSVLTVSFFILSTMLRAYSAEICGVTVCTYLVLTLKNNQRPKRLIIYGLLTAFFCWTRYDFIVFAFVATLYIAYTLLKSNDVKTFLTKSAFFSLPVLISVISTYLVTMRFQNPYAGNIGYSTYISTTPSVLYSSPLMLAFYIISGYAVYKKTKEKTVPDLVVLSFSVMSLYVVLSALNMFPIDVMRTTSATVLIHTVLMTEFIKTVKGKFILPIGILSAVYAVVLFAVLNFFSFFDLLGITQMRELMAFKETNKTDKVFVSFYENPDVRYVFEYGDYKDRQKEYGYPEKFYFQKGPIHSLLAENQKVIKAEEIECDTYLLMPALFSLGVGTDGKPNLNIFDNLSRTIECFEKVDGYDFLYRKK